MEPMAQLYEKPDVPIDVGTGCCVWFVGPSESGKPPAAKARALIGPSRCSEIFLATPLELCAQQGFLAWP